MTHLPTNEQRCWHQGQILPGDDIIPNLGLPSYEYVRQLRGGSWVSDSHDLRSAARKQSWPDCKTGFYGFRIARQLK